ncbi:MAG: D-alanyl-D-alanine carboxypeptidase [Chlorobiaceae bacterium]|nr:D-alanyl-D-alanine carboxypeptidase [Chlorobiaceae bacterium]
MKRYFCAIMAACTLAAPAGRAYATRTVAQDDVTVTSYILKETGSQNVLMSRDVDRPVSPASLTKIMTCVMAIESGRMDDVVTIPKEATMVEPTRAGLLVGEKIRLRDLVKAAMVNSSNDAAFSIAVHLGGSVDSFVAQMNSRARALGMSNTSFTNPAGYDKGIYVGNRSTARDLMILTEHAVRNPEFNAIAKLDRAVFTELTTGKTYSLKTHNKLLAIYPYTVGIKTGYTARAGCCLIARAIKDRKDLLMVMLDARTNRWSMASDMFDRGFESNGGEQLQALSSPRQDSGMVKASPVNRENVERERALSALKLKLARQGDVGSPSIVNASLDQRQAATSVKASNRATPQARFVVKQKTKAASSARTALKGKKSRQDRLALKSRQGSRHEARLALKDGHKRAERKVALKSGKRGPLAVKTAVKGRKKVNGEARATKQRNARKEQLSMSSRVEHTAKN